MIFQYVAANLSLSLNAALPIVLLLWFVREAFYARADEVIE